MTVVLETVDSAESGRGLSIYANDSTTAEVVELPFEGALFAPLVRLIEGTVAVFGVRCPSLDLSQASAASFSTSPSEVCARTEFELFRFDVRNKIWAEPTTVGESSGGFIMQGAGGSRLILAPVASSRSEGDADREMGNPVVLDASTGAVTPITPPRDGIEAYCPGRDGSLVAVRSELADGGSSSDDDAVSASGDGTAIYYSATGTDSWQDVAVDEKLTGTSGCSEDGFFWRDATSALFFSSIDDRLQFVTSDVAFPSGPSALIQQSFNLEVVAIAEDPEYSDSPAAQRVWAWRDGRWQSLGEVVMASGDMLLSTATAAIAVPRPDNLWDPITLRGDK